VNQFEPGGQLSFKTLVGGPVVGALDAQIILRGDAPYGIAGVLVPFAVAEALGAGIVRILQVPRRSD